MRTSLFLVAVVLTLCAGHACGYPTDPERTALVRATYENVPADVLGIVEPVRGMQSDAYEDGGTAFVRFTDARGTPFVACLDGRERVEDPGDGKDFWTSNLEAIENYHLYLDAQYPTDATAVQVLVRGPEESALYGLLLRWAKNQPRTEEVAAMKTVIGCPDEDLTLYRVHRLLERFDWRFGIQRPR
jgi:hypothetical protein